MSRPTTSTISIRRPRVSDETRPQSVADSGPFCEKAARGNSSYYDTAGMEP